jgi:hypothetical protein
MQKAEFSVQYSVGYRNVGGTILNTEVKLERKLKPINVWSLALGSIIGWGAFVMPGTTFLPKAGPLGTLIGMAIAACVMICIALNYGYMVQKYPVAGGEYTFAKNAFGTKHAYLCGWFLSLSYLAIVPLNATALGLVSRKLLGGVLEFGHLSRDKGTLTLLQAAKQMPQTKFLFAGYGAAEEEIAKVQNAEYVGFKTGEELKQLIGKALCSVYPSEWYENCPFSVIESQMYGTPVVASNMGGIPELIEEGKTGLLFKAGDYKDLESKLRYLLENKAVLDEFTQNCKAVKFETPQSYYEKILRIYGEDV